MGEALPRGSLPVADAEDFLCLEDLPGYVHILVGWRGRCKLDGPSAEKLLAFVTRALRALSRPIVVLDISNVSYMNSQAVGVLAGRIARLVRAQGGDLRLYNPDPWVRQLLLTLHLEPIFSVVEKLPEPA